MFLCFFVLQETDPWFVVHLKKTMFVYVVHLITKGKTNLLKISVGSNDFKRERGCLYGVEKTSMYVVHCVPPVYGEAVKVQQTGTSQRLNICDIKIFALGKL